MYYGLNFEGARSKKDLILSSKKGLIRSYFQSPKKRGHPAYVNYLLCMNLPYPYSMLENVIYIILIWYWMDQYKPLPLPCKDRALGGKQKPLNAIWISTYTEDHCLYSLIIKNKKIWYWIDQYKPLPLPCKDRALGGKQKPLLWGNSRSHNVLYFSKRCKCNLSIQAPSLRFQRWAPATQSLTCEEASKQKPLPWRKLQGS